MLEPVTTDYDGNDWHAWFASRPLEVASGDTERAAVDALLDQLEDSPMETPTEPAHLAALSAHLPSQLRLHMPAARYHASPGLSISRLKRLAVSPMHFAFVPPVDDQSVPMHLGAAAHCATLEPARFERDYVMWNRYSDAGNLCPRKGQFWDAFVAAHPGQDIIQPEEHERAMCMQRAVRGDKWAMKYLERGGAEVSMRWMMRGRLCRGRADWMTVVDGKPHLVGLKTAADCRLFKFSNAAARYGYHLQWAWYHDGYDLIRHVRPAMKEIVVESSPPYAVVVYDVPDEVIDQGRDEYSRLLELLADCERANEWPGPAMGGEVTFSLPSWAYHQDDTDDITAIGLEV